MAAAAMLKSPRRLYLSHLTTDFDEIRYTDQGKQAEFKNRVTDGPTPFSKIAAAAAMLKKALKAVSLPFMIRF
jgi:hypothetical protein